MGVEVSIMSLDDNNGSWRDLEPTPPQLRMLSDWGIKADGLNRGEVSDLITDELAARRRESADYDEPDYDDQA